jgi:Innexin
MNTFCWAQSKFHLVQQSESLDEAIDYAKWMYFQVSFTVQAFFLYCPHYLWNLVANRTLKKLTSELESLTVEPERKRELKRLPVEYFKYKDNSNYLSEWLLACEIANFIHMLIEFTCFAKDIIDKVRIFPPIITVTLIKHVESCMIS